jgi:O-antigen/teichoic acid export membrane protein
MDHQESPMLGSQDVAESDFEGPEPSKTIEVDTSVYSESTSFWPGMPWLPQVFSAATTGGLAILGQGTFAGSHFLMNVLLARWLSPEEYGAFALAYSGFLLFLMLYGACVYEPLIVFGSGRHAGRFQEYFGLLARGNVLVLGVLSCLMLASSSLLSRFLPSGVERDFAALSLAAPFVLVTWLGRGGFYARMKPGEAAWGGTFYFFTLLAAIVLLRLDGRLSGSSAFLGMGLAGLTSNVFLLYRLGFRWRGVSGTLRMERVWGDHWSYGRWALASALVSWFPQNIYYALLPARTGLEGAAALRALTNLINPLLQTLSALAAVLIPVLVRHHQEGGIVRVRTTMKMLTVLLIPGSLVYFFLVLWMGRSFLFQSLYAGKYQEYKTWPLLLTGLVPITTTAAIIVGSALRALEKPEFIFWSYAASTASVIVLGLPLTLHSGVLGATGSLFFSSLVAAVIMAWFFHRATSTETQNFSQELQ